jgi:hypothetical protein
MRSQLGKKSVKRRIPSRQLEYNVGGTDSVERECVEYLSIAPLDVRAKKINRVAL